MKILFLSSLYSPHVGGGAEIVLQRTVEGLKARGADVVVLATGPQPGLHVTEVRGVKVYRAGLLNTYWHFSEQRPNALARLGWHLRDRYNSGMRRFIAEVLSREAVELVVCHNLAGWSVAAWDEIAQARLPSVQVLHDMYLSCPGSNMFRKGSACASPCTLCRSFRQGHAERSAQVDAVVGVSRFLLDRLRSQQFFRGAHAQVIYSASAPPDALVSARFNEPRRTDRPLRFGYMGTLSEQKGLRWLIEQFRTLAFPATLSIAGRGQADYEQTLKALAGTPNITFIGYQSPESFYRQVDVAVVPSIWNEPFGLVAVEACAHSVPVIASNRGGLPEIIRDGTNGLLCDPAQPRSLGQAMARMNRDPVLRDRLASQARASVEHFLDTEQMLDRYQALFRQVVQNRSPRHDNDVALYSL
ncbi:glycosyltransferase family 4 protein [Pseudomonas typographi]|uniref:Glycosyltransferase family 4 protein n=1 Tax=Pseudomonas typographi TaxID=2715964 RepID=A0ABR7YVF0_9PSED|nr:glycosyltransferase family 4 protein [Pseudomonas typographi]MBD1552157.1 glycosyltransferase family 4 protein [Pseudomonas typographi]MBD1585129.1 glycosyltransferase family 4 protein [Pseudomonas typographi]MBD1597176.1 glycosyltransferase family 4 protein [Pseudomonas typographi]